jgi:DNA polymerase-4
LWKGEPIRHLGVSVTALQNISQLQLSIFHEKNYVRNLALDKTVDSIRMKYGSRAIIKSTFLNSGIKPLSGGVGEESYPMMSSIL